MGLRASPFDGWAERAALARPAGVRRLAVATAAMIAIVWLIAGGAIWHSRDAAIKEWSSTAEITATMAAAYSSRSIAATDLVLASMLDWIAEEDIDTPARFEQVFGQRKYFDKLRERIAYVPQIDVATFINIDGTIITFSRLFPQPGINLADRDYFKAQAVAGAPPTSLGNVVKNRGTGRWTFYKAKQVRSRAGTVLGVVIVGIEAEYFAGFFRQILPSPESSITLWRNDATVLATSSLKEDLLGRQFPTAAGPHLLSQHPQGAITLLTAPPLLSDTTSTDRVLAVRAVANEPAYIAVAIEADSILSGWRFDRNVTLAIALALTATILWGSWQSRRLQADREEHRASETEQQVLRAIVDMPLALTAVIDREGRVLRSNASFDGYFRAFAKSGELNIADVPGADPITAFARGGEASSEAEARVTGAAGEARILRFAMARQALPGLGTCSIVVGADETEYHATQLAIAQSAKMVTLGEMATGMAHELNQPINIIHMAAQNALGEVEPLEPGDPAPAPSQAGFDIVGEKLRTILSQSARAASLISHMRVFGRVPREKPVVFDVRAACEGALGLVGQQIRSNGIAIELSMGELPLPVRGHQTLLEQVIVNLLVNARDSLSARTDGTGCIDLACRGVGGKVEIELGDNGPGVPEKLRSRIFDPFFTTKDIGQGTGLGLAISYGIVSEMNGTIALLHSEKGARFRIELPAAVPA